jgi:murein DD-endopeptidase MepM/ murein hydrolase activator NlpD
MGTVLRRILSGPGSVSDASGRRIAGQGEETTTVRSWMTKRRLLTGLIATAICGSGVGFMVHPAQAEQRTLLVTLLGGQTITVTVDVPPGTPVDQIQIPGVSTPIIGVSEIPSEQPAPPPPPPPADDQQQPSGGAPQESNGPSQPGAPAAAEPTKTGKPQQEAQKTTGKAKRKAQEELESADDAAAATEQKDKKAKPRRADGAPTPDNPTYTLALPGPAPVGVPNFFIEKFRIPPFLLSIYQAAGIEYGIRWEVLAAINEIETDYGRNLNISTAGAVGWMQFLPSTWRRYGVDANQDERKDPYNPVDAVFAAARYLKAAGAQEDLRKAIFAYNHADWYVDSVLLRARLIGGLPADFVGSLTGLTEGHFPVHGKATYADDISERQAMRRMKKGENAAIPVEAASNRRSIDIYAKSGTPVVAVQDGEIVSMGVSQRLGNYVKLRDAYGNTYTYGGLKSLASEYPVPKPRATTKSDARKELELPKADPKPEAPASAGRQVAEHAAAAAPSPSPSADAAESAAPEVHKERLFANPSRPAAFKAGGRDQILDMGGAVPGVTTFKSYFTEVFGLDKDQVVIKRLKPGSKVIAGTILGRIGVTQIGKAAHTQFEIRPAGRGAPRIDPKPILDGWKLLESTAIYRATGKNPFYGDDAEPSIGQVLLMSKEALQRQVLQDPRVEIYGCGREDIQAGEIDRRVLATLEFLSSSGLKPTVTSLHCGHSFLTTSGNVSEHSTGTAVDIAKVNGIPIYGHQGSGSITDITIRRLLTLQGTMKPHQIISLMTYPNADNTLALADHDDHIHVGFRPLYGPGAVKFNSVLKPDQWMKLIDRLKTIDNPTVPLRPSRFALPVTTTDDANAGD